MYVDDKQLKFEIKEVHSSIHELANDLGGDIRYLHQEISELRETIDILQQDIRQLKEQINGSSVNLTVDSKMQFILFDKLKKAVEFHNAESASGIMIDLDSNECQKLFRAFTTLDAWMHTNENILVPLICQ